MARIARDLAGELFARLHSRSPGHAERFRALFINQHPSWAEGNVPSHERQIYEINEFWRVQLGMLTADTLHARSCIVDNLEPDVWLSNFDRYIMEAVLYQPIPNQRWSGRCA